MPKRTTKELQALIHHEFVDEQLIKTALTHSSAGAAYNYERLEFLGDRVLGLVIAELLYKRFPHEAEGDMAKRLAALVQGTFIADIAHDMGLGDFIDLSDAESAAGGAQNANILADVFESMIGALYLDGGFKKCQQLIHDLWADKLDVMKEPPQHPKTKIQEWAQSQGLPLPDYKIIGQSGPDHAPIFEIQLNVKNYPPIIAIGKSRGEAEKLAAKLFAQTIISPPQPKENKKS